MIAPPPRTRIVVPCYNEAARLDGAAFLAALDRQPELGFVFVDDGSQDATAGVLGLDTNQGKAEAVRRGVLEAFTDSSAALVGYWDADLATPLGAIATFSAILDEPRIQMVMGSRVKLMGRHIERDLTRHYLGRGFATLIAFALDLPVYDTQCGAKLFRANPLFARVFARRFRSRWTFDVEILARLLEEERSGAIQVAEQCVECPLEAWRDQPGSKLKLAHAPRILLEIARLFRDSPRRSTRR